MHYNWHKFEVLTWYEFEERARPRFVLLVFRNWHLWHVYLSTLLHHYSSWFGNRTCICIARILAYIWCAGCIALRIGNRLNQICNVKTQTPPTASKMRAAKLGEICYAYACACAGLLTEPNVCTVVRVVDSPLPVPLLPRLVHQWSQVLVEQSSIRPPSIKQPNKSFIRNQFCFSSIA